MRLLCIDGHFKLDQKIKLADWPKEGEIYTIRKRKLYFNGRIGYYLNEIINNKTVGNPPAEPTFNPRRFVEIPDPTNEVLEYYHEFATQ